ncbi:prh1 [[Candida] subhashii]|uniref:RNA helicase n=1 Tax=[Candida] subhashii TaxID=561895 RepID=A0A8J5UTQ9_9ASCO|nr:prh1 [[Candida] subhashii]KAG7665657.1 prh1 [[Candida] subhashii]
MTEQVKADVHNQNGTKKRKRRRNKGKQEPEPDIVKPEPEKVVQDGRDELEQIKRQNKKLKFDSEPVNGSIEVIKETLNSEQPDQQEEQEEENKPNGVVDKKHHHHESKEEHKHKHKHKHKHGEKEHKHHHKHEEKHKHKHHHNKTVKFHDKEDTNPDSDDDPYTNTKFTIPSDHQSQALSQRATELLEIRKSLPIYQHRSKITQYINNNQVTIIIGETGSGKSTQIPQFLMDSLKPGQMIGVTQPRRVAAASLASRVSEEYGCKLGHEVGYQVRFTNMTHHRTTKLKYLTDGMLLREIMLENRLSKYGIIILDEAHERTILTDLIMGFLKSLIESGERKDDLKIVVMSATLNAELFSGFFNNAPVLYVEGKMYPVTQLYLTGEDSQDIVDTMIRTVIQVNLNEPEGDILCFLAGQEEIDNCVNVLTTISPQLPKQAPIIVPLPLYAALSPSQQSKIFEKLPPRRRKVILATNIAETSITVPGVKYVIDSGLRKVKVWKHNLGLSTLLTTPISQASARQRAGRAGRESPGKVFRLYPESIYSTLPKQQESEIKRNDIILPILTLKKLGIDDLLNWTWLEFPGQEAILSALNSLYMLGALDDGGKITRLGYKMSILPLQPQLSVVLLTASEWGVLGPVVDIVSCLSVDNLILNVTGESRDDVNFKRRGYCPLGGKYGDLIAVYEYFQNFKELYDGNVSECKEWCSDLWFSFKGFKNVIKVRNQLKDYMLSTIRQDDSLSSEEREVELTKLRAQFADKHEEDDDDEVDVKGSLNIPAILKSFLKGYITNTAVGMPDRSFRTFNTGQLISIHPSSNLFGKANLDAIMYIEYVYTMKGYARNCSAIELSWLQEIAPHIIGGNKINVNE